MTKPFTEERILVGQVNPGESLAVRDGDHRVLFQVEKKSFEFGTDDDGRPFQKFVLESEPLRETGKPWILEFPSDAFVTRIRRVA